MRQALLRIARFESEKELRFPAGDGYLQAHGADVHAAVASDHLDPQCLDGLVGEVLVYDATRANSCPADEYDRLAIREGARS